jgi:hypothetical protein
MRAFDRAILALALVASPAVATAQVDYDKLQPSATQAIVAATQECRAALTPAGVDEAPLIAAGWARIVATGDNRSREDSRHELSRGQTILWLTQRDASCIVMCRLQDLAQFDGVIEALVAVLGQPTVRKPDGGVLWLQASGAGVQANRTGSRSKPAVRLFILPATR